MGCSLPASLSMGFSREEYWSGLPCPPPGDLPDPGIESSSLKSPELAGGFPTRKPHPSNQKPTVTYLPCLKSALTSKPSLHILQLRKASNESDLGEKEPFWHPVAVSSGNTGSSGQKVDCGKTREGPEASCALCSV